MYGVGVDLGTSFSAAAVAADGDLDMVRLSGAATVTPSVAFLDRDGQLLTGEAADRLGLQNPSRAAWEFKRRIGDPTPVLLGGAPFSPTALMAALLSSVLDTVSQARGEPPQHVVLTHPAVWGVYRREQFAAIPRLAGLPGPDSDVAASGPSVLTITEPVAAATYYCSTRPLPPGGLLAVYDLGGGTFDSAVVRNGRSGLEIVGTPEGIEWLGGADFDHALLDYVDRQLGAVISGLDPADPRTAPILAGLHRECVVAKEALSTREQAHITVPLPGGPRHVTISRDVFEQMITPALDTTIEAFRRTLASAGVTPQGLTGVLLVGGSSQIPRITELLRDTLRRPILINTHPKHAVALGAAMLSAQALAQRGIAGGRRSSRRFVPGAATTRRAQPPSAEPSSGTPVEAADVATAGRPEKARAYPASEATPVAPLPLDATPGDTDAPAPLDAAPGGPPTVRDARAGAAHRRPKPPSTRVLVVTLVAVVAALVGAAFLPSLRTSNGNAGACGPHNVALHRPATASSPKDPGDVATNAVDGDTHTRWVSTADGPQWLQVDLGEALNVCGVTILWESGYATGFRIGLSPDGITWRDIYSTTAGRGGGERLTVSGTGRYIQLNCTAGSAPDGCSLNEFTVFAAGKTGDSTSTFVDTLRASPDTTPSASPTADPTASVSPVATATPKPSASSPATVPAGGIGLIQNVGSGLCVDSDTNPKVTLNGVPLGGHAFTKPCDGSLSQQWREGPLLSSDNPPVAGWYRLLDQWTGFCLDSNGNGDIYTLPCLNADDYQLWQRVTVQPSPTSPTVVAYHNRATNRCISVNQTDKTLSTQPCPTDNRWPASMQFRRRP